jgi:hypothetical protein
VLLYAGRICDQKQPRVFAATMLELHKKGLEFVTIVAGDGVDRPMLEEFSARHGLQHHLRFLGAVPNARMKELMAASDVFFLPSLWEGISLAIFEAMAAGLAIVGGDVGGQRELVTPDCGVLIKRSTPEREATEYAQALTPLMKMAAERGIAVVAVCHQNKKSESNLSVIQRVQGSAAFGQAARVVLAMFNDPDDDTADDSRRRLMIVAKSNYGGRNTGKAYRLKQRDGDAEPHIHWLPGDVTVDANDLGRKPSGGREHEERIGDALDTLRGLLANGPRAGAEIEAELKAANLGRRQIDKACSKLEVAKEQVTDDQGKRFWQWSLPAPSVGRVEPFSEFEGNWSAGFGD